MVMLPAGVPSRPRAAGSRGAACLILAVALAVAGCGEAPDTVRGSGTIELDEVDVASQVGGRVERLLVDEGDTVRAGDTLAVLEQGEVLAALEQRAADAARAVAQLRDLTSGARSQELEAAEAALQAAIAQWQLASSEATRAETLYQRNVASEAELERARAERDAAGARRLAAQQQVALLRAGSRSDLIRAGMAAEVSARAQLEAARSRAHELVLLAPISGTVLLRNLNRGELAAPAVPVVTLGDPQRLWMRVYVPAPRIGEVHRGDSVTVRVTGFRQAFHGRVIEIATQAEFTPRAALTEEERANLVFGVKVALDSEGGTLKPGLPADAIIRGGAPAAGPAPARP